MQGWTCFGSIQMRQAVLAFSTLTDSTRPKSLSPSTFFFGGEMPVSTQILSVVDHELSEIRSLVDALLFINEEVEEPHAERMRSVTITILYVMGDKLRRANQELIRSQPPN